MKDKVKKEPTTRIKALAGEMVKDIKDGKRRTGRQLMKDVGYSSVTAEKQSKRTLTSESLRSELIANGVDEQKIQRVLNEAMDANVVVVFKGQAHETKIADHATRLRSVDQLASYTGIKKQVVENRTLNLDVPPDVVRQMVGMPPSESAKLSKESG